MKPDWVRKEQKMDESRGVRVKVRMQVTGCVDFAVDEKILEQDGWEELAAKAVMPLIEGVGVSFKKILPARAEMQEQVLKDGCVASTKEEHPPVFENLEVLSVEVLDET